MKNYFFLLALMLWGALCFAQTTINGGQVFGTWSKAQSPVTITADINVPKGFTLTIKPGVEVIFSGAYEFDIKGQIKAEGQLDDSIIFTTNGANWLGFTFDPFGGMPDSVMSVFKYCRIEKAEKSHGGAIYIQAHDSVTISNCLIQKNTADLGGVCFINKCAPTFMNNTFLFNEATSSAAVLYVSGSTSRIENNLFSNNKAQSDGVVCLSTSDNVKFNGNIICNNQVDQHSAGLYFNECSPVLSNNTIAYNKVRGPGSVYGSNSSPVFYNTILYGNTKYFDYPEYSQVAIYTDFQPSFHYSLVQGGVEGFDNTWNKTYTGTTSNIVDADPVFFSAPDTCGLAFLGYTANWGLTPELSPCIDAGTPDTAGLKLPITDIEGNKRIGNVIDMGAWENSGNIKPVITLINDVEFFMGQSHKQIIAFKDYNTDDTHTIVVSTDNDSVYVSGLSGHTSGSQFTISSADDYEGSAIITVKVSENGIVGSFSSISFKVTIKSSTKVAGGEVKGVWTKANSPYAILNSITIPDNETLLIEPGVKVFVSSWQDINVLGTLIAKGTASDSIIFTSTGSPWGSIILDNSQETSNAMLDNDSSIFEFCSFSNSNVWNWNRGTLTIKNFPKYVLNHCQFSKNSRPLYIEDSEVNITNCSFIDNANGGLRINNDWHTPGFISNCKFINNTSDESGGAIDSYGTDMNLVNCLFANNYSKKDGGAINSIWDECNLINNTFINNKAEGRGGALYSYSTNKINNCILWGNNAGKGDQVYNNSGGGLPFTNSIIQKGAVFPEQIACSYTDPLLDGSFYPLPDSRAINQGTLSIDTLLSTDLAGNTRISDKAIDIGAYEYQGAPSNREPKVFIDSSFQLMFNDTLVVDFVYDDPDDDEHTVTLSGNNQNINATVEQFAGKGKLIVISQNGFLGNGNLTLWVDDNSGKENAVSHVNITIEVTDKSTLRPTQNITTSTEWNTQIVEVNSDIIIAEGATLNIAEGTKILFKGYYGIYVYGNLNIYGTEAQPVLFTASDTNGYSEQSFEGWKGIRFLNKSSFDTVHVSCAIFEYANNLFSDNFTEGSTILVNNGAKHVFNNCTFQYNIASVAAGISMYSSSLVTVNSCLFQKNQGRIISMEQRQKLVVSDSRFINNYSENSVIHCSGSQFEIRNCLFDSNSGDRSYTDGIGLNAVSSKGLVTNCIFTNNESSRGELNFWMCDVNVENCSFINNIGTRDRVSIYTVNSIGRVYNSLFWNPNHNYSIADHYEGDTSNFIVENCLLEDNGFSSLEFNSTLQVQNNIFGNPALQLGEFAYTLSKTSNCINAGDSSLNSGKKSIDFFGNNRLVGGKLDIGAVEFHFDNKVSAIGLTDSIINEKQKPPYFISRLITNDVDMEDVFTFNIDWIVAPGISESDFYISNDSLYGLKLFDADTHFNVIMNIKAKNAKSDSILQRVNLYVNDIPEAIEISNNSIYENNAIHDVVGQITATDKNWIIFSVADDRLKDQFKIEDGKLMTMVSFNYENSPKVYDVLVKATDKYNATTTKLIRINIEDVEEKPVAKFIMHSVYENTVDSLVCEFSFYDDDFDTVTPTLMSVNNLDASEFVEMIGNEIKVISPFDFEQDSVINIALSYTDGFYTIDTVLQAQIIDVNENVDGVKDVANEIQTIVYPNPGSGLFYLKTNGVAVSKVEVYNVQGTKVYDCAGNVSTKLINLNDFENGIYLLKLTLNNKTKTIRIVKQ